MAKLERKLEEIKNLNRPKHQEISRINEEKKLNFNGKFLTDQSQRVNLFIKK